MEMFPGCQAKGQLVTTPQHKQAYVCGGLGPMERMHKNIGKICQHLLYFMDVKESISGRGGAC